MDITERDLYNFVFSKDNLAEDKARYIESSNIFNDEISFLSSMKEFLSEDISAEIKEEIARKITAYQFSPAIDVIPDSKKQKERKKTKAD
jgi:hypothetical protein